MNAVTDALQSDYQNTKTFRDAVLNTLYDMVYRTVYAEEIEKEAREDAEWQELWQSGSQTFPDWYSESWDPEHYRYVQGRPNPYQDTANLLYYVTYLCALRVHGGRRPKRSGAAGGPPPGSGAGVPGLAGGSRRPPSAGRE